MNDPNGLIHWRGAYHFFYQYNPDAPVWRERLSWGHAASDDLVRWRDLPNGLEPSTDGPDREGCWSGCAVADGDAAHLVYTGRSDGSEHTCLATTHVELLDNWVKNPAPITAAPEDGPGFTDLRDPCVWRDAERWRLLLGGAILDDGPAVVAYSGTKLTNLGYDGVLLRGASVGSRADVWECPDAFRIGDFWALVVSEYRRPDEMLGTRLFVGSFEGRAFSPMWSGPFDTGTRFYAPQSLESRDGRRIAFGWIRETGADFAPATVSRLGLASLPRTIALDGGTGLISIAPAREVDSLRVAEVRIAVQRRRRGVSVDGGTGSPTIGELRIVLGPSPWTSLALHIDGLTSEGSLVRHVVPVERWIEPSGASSTRRVSKQMNERTSELRMFIDQGAIEVYVSDGPPSTVLMPTLASVREVTVVPDRANDATSIIEADGWELENIWG